MKIEIRYRGKSTEEKPSQAAAIRAVKAQGLHWRVATPDGIYCYADRAAMLRDDSGASADAVICTPEE